MREQLLCQWQQNQAEWLDQEAETIRNGLLQDLFAVRRKLELLDGQATDCLVDFEHLYHSLKHLADRLSSPYIHDSFPLAIQHTVSIWGQNATVKALFTSPLARGTCRSHIPGTVDSG